MSSLCGIDPQKLLAIMDIETKEILGNCQILTNTLIEKLRV